MIFVINSGSSSLKFKLFDVSGKGGKDSLREVASGIVERIGLEAPFLKTVVGGRENKASFDSVPDHSDALRRVVAALKAAGFTLDNVCGFGHRVVHGGEEFVKPTLVDAGVLARLKTYNQLAPLHNPANLMGIEAVMAAFKGVPNAAVFDTAFYRTIPAEAFMYALPYGMYSEHKIRKYGFHGISHQYVTAKAAALLKKPLSKLKLISCHLGSGSSITAVKNGKAVDTSMGFTPLEGLTMSTRCGDIDPAIPLYLIRELKMTPERVDDMMNKESGLLGISGHKDMRDVLLAAGYKLPGAASVKASAEDKRLARLALDMFVYDVVRYVGQFAAVMGGVDALIFTAGIGERSALVRKLIADRLKSFRKMKIMVVPTDEELMIARETWDVLP